VIYCTDGTSVLVLDGIDGEDGAQGEQGEAGEDGTDGADAPISPYSITEAIDPCGSETAYDEVLLRLGNGSLLAHYSDGAKQHLTVIGAGSYTTTDSTNCVFVVHTDGSVTW
jgi:hypothetical protein